MQTALGEGKQQEFFFSAAWSSSLSPPAPPALHWSTFGCVRYEWSGSVTSWALRWLNKASSHSAAPGESLTVCGGRTNQEGEFLEIAAAARLLFLGLDVFVDLELGFVGMLDGSMLQLPEEQIRYCAVYKRRHTEYIFIFFYSVEGLLWKFPCWGKGNSFFYYRGFK